MLILIITLYYLTIIISVRIKVQFMSYVQKRVYIVNYTLSLSSKN